MIEWVDEKRKVGEVVSINRRSRVFEVVIEEQGKCKWTEEFLMGNDTFDIGENNEVVYKKKPVPKCESCNAEAFYDSEENEYYCPKCIQ